MNPALPQGVIDRALAENPSKASAEYLNIWREDSSDFIPPDVVEAGTDFKVYERPPQPGIHYVAFCDAAGGLGSDSFTLAIAHREPDDTGTVVLDLLREKKPRFVPRDVVAEFAALLKAFNVFEVWGDKFAGGFHADEWTQNGILFKPCERTTSENYLHWLPMLLARRARLLDNATLRAQVCALEHYIPPGGHEVVRHPQIASAHDDCATAAAGAMVAAGDRLAFLSDYSWVSDDKPEPAAGNELWRRTLLRQYLTACGMPPWIKF